MYKVTINLPNLAKGADVEIDGLGVFANGSTNEISNEVALAFRAKHTTQGFEYNDEGNMKVSLKQGPTVLQAFEDNDHIKVEVYEPKEKKGDDK